MTSEEAGCTFHVDHGMSLREGSMIWVAVRPEKISIGKAPPAEATYNAVAGQVMDLGYLGNLSIYRIKLESGKMVRVTSQNQRRSSEAERNVDWDDKVYLTWESSSPVVLTE